MMFEAIQVEGLAELNRAFAQVDKELGRRLRTATREAAQPVAAMAHELAIDQISGLQRRRAVDWGLMRVGGTNVVYVAPQQRGRFSKQNPSLRRPNLANRLVDVLDKAAERARPEVERRVEQAVDEVVREAGLG